MNQATNVVALVILLGVLQGCAGGTAASDEVSDHFDGKYFFNRSSADKSVGDLLRFGFGSLFKSEKWPDSVSVERRQVSQERVYDGISVTFLTHASFLIQVAGVNILTDPIYSNRASPVQWAGPKRVHAPGVRFKDLPPIDVILISHDHSDHLDAATLERFANAGGKQPLVLAGLGNSELLKSLGLTNTQDMDWQESVKFEELEFVFSECKHRSGRGIVDQMTTLWGAYVIKTPAGNLYFAGDTGYSPHFKETGNRYGPFVLSMLPIGAYEPRWFMKDVHTNPLEAVQAHLDLRSEFSLGMHFGTFQLTYESIGQPLRDLEVALTELEVDPAKFQAIKPGDSLAIDLSSNPSE